MAPWGAIEERRISEHTLLLVFHNTPSSPQHTAETAGFSPLTRPWLDGAISKTYTSPYRNSQLCDEYFFSWRLLYFPVSILCRFAAVVAATAERLFEVTVCIGFFHAQTVKHTISTYYSRYRYPLFLTVFFAFSKCPLFTRAEDWAAHTLHTVEEEVFLL